jgi:NAD(P)-dependent dehydrogenase (short-subunit alcohol dehydrogenase family)
MAPHHRDRWCQRLPGQVTLRPANITAKQGMHGLAKVIAHEFGADGIIANTVPPGPIDTVPDWSQHVHEQPERIKADVPQGNYGHPDEIAGASQFLTSAARGSCPGRWCTSNCGRATCTDRNHRHRARTIWTPRARSGRRRASPTPSPGSTRHGP